MMRTFGQILLCYYGALIAIYHNLMFASNMAHALIRGVFVYDIRGSLIKVFFYQLSLIKNANYKR